MSLYNCNWALRIYFLVINWFRLFNSLHQCCIVSLQTTAPKSNEVDFCYPWNPHICPFYLNKPYLYNHSEPLIFFAALLKYSKSTFTFIILNRPLNDSKDGTIIFPLGNLIIEELHINVVCEVKVFMKVFLFMIW